MYLLALCLASPFSCGRLHDGTPSGSWAGSDSIDPSEFSPLDLPGLAFYFESDNGAIAEGRYSVIPNQGFLGNDLVSGAEGPTEVSLRGESAAHFDGIQSLVYSGPASDFANLSHPTGEATITFRLSDVQVGAHTILCTGRNGVGRGFWIYRPSPTSVQVRVINDSGVDHFLHAQYCLPHDVVTITKDAEGLALFVNGESQGTVKARAPSPGAPTFQLRIGNTEVSGSAVKGLIPILMIQDQVDMANDVKKVNYIHKRWGTGINFVALGNSYTAGHGSAYSPSDNWVRRMDLSASGESLVRRVALSGRTTPQLTELIESRVAPLFIGSGDEMLMIWEAGNDMLYGSSPTEAYAHLVAAKDTARAHGWMGPIGTMTILYRADLDRADVDEFHDILRANWAADGFAICPDFVDHPALAVPASGDEIHPNTEQYAIIAQYAAKETLGYFGYSTERMRKRER